MFESDWSDDESSPSSLQNLNADGNHNNNGSESGEDELMNEQELAGHSDLFILSTFVNAVLQSVFCLTGLYGNGLSWMVFRHRSMRAPINVLLTALSAIDFCLLLLTVPVIILPNLNYFLHSQPLQVFYQYSILGLYPLNMTAHTSSIWTFVLISVERYLAVCQPLNRHKLLTYREAKYAQIVVVIAAFFYNLVRYWEWAPDDRSASQNGIVPLLRSETFYRLFYFAALYMLTQFLLPFAIILLLNFAIIRSLRQSSSCSYQLSVWKFRKTSGGGGVGVGVGVGESTTISGFERDQRQHHSLQRQQRKITQMIVVITFMFAGCNAPAFVLNIWEGLQPELFKGRMRAVAYVALDASNLLIILNSASTFFVYMVFCRKYRLLFASYGRCTRAYRHGRRDSQRWLWPEARFQAESLSLPAAPVARRLPNDGGGGGGGDETAPWTAGKRALSLTQTAMLSQLKNADQTTVANHRR